MLGQRKWLCPINHRAFGIYCLSLWDMRERERQTGRALSQEAMCEGEEVRTWGLPGTQQLKEISSPRWHDAPRPHGGPVPAFSASLLLPAAFGGSASLPGFSTPCLLFSSLNRAGERILAPRTHAPARSLAKSRELGHGIQLSETKRPVYKMELLLPTEWGSCGMP